MHKFSAVIIVTAIAAGSAVGDDPKLSLTVSQVTRGPQHHFFGYIGHVGTIPWNGNGQYIAALRTTFQDHMPAADEAAEIVLIDTQDGNRVRVVDRTRAWNPQQGTMLYWNPEKPETQFFFNDRDPVTNKVFCVLFDIAEGNRVREYRFHDTPVGNSGVAQKGGAFLAINYARLARLRPVTGYPDAYDWTDGVMHPADDGIFRFDVTSGEKVLLVSYQAIAEVLRPDVSDIDHKALFINHTLWNRDGDRIFFFARADFETPGRVDVPFVMNADGTNLRRQPVHFGGHPEWAEGHRMIGRRDDDQVVYDTDTQAFVETWGNPAIFPKPGGDIALSPNGRLFVNGYGSGSDNYYVIYRRSDGAHVRSPGFSMGEWRSGPLRLDPGPCWNRDGTAILVPGLADDSEKTRQLFVVQISEK